MTLRNATGGTDSEAAKRTITSTGGKLAIIGITVDGTGLPRRQPEPEHYGGGIRTDSDLGLYANTIVRNANLGSVYGDVLGGGGIMVNGDGLHVIVTDDAIVETNDTGIRVDNTDDLIDIEGSDLIISGGAVIRENYLHGGVFAGTGWNLTVTDDAQVLFNKGGGGIGLYTLTSALLRSVVMSGNVLVQGNSSSISGGGVSILFPGGDEPFLVTITGNVRIIDNAAGEHGGGIATWDTIATIDGDVLIANNIAYSSGGGVYHRRQYVTGTFTVAGSAVVRDNSANLGGGIAFEGSSVVIEGSARITDNASRQAGGGVSLQFGDGGPASLTTRAGSLIARNIALEEGGGVYSDSLDNTLDAAVGTILDNDPNNCGGLGISC